MQTLSPTEMQEVAQIIMGLLEKKIMDPLSGEKFPLSKFNQAIAKSQVHRKPIYLNNLNHSPCVQWKKHFAQFPTNIGYVCNGRRMPVEEKSYLLMMSKSAHLLKQEIPAATEFSWFLTW